MSVPFGAGQRMLFDAHQKFVQSSLPVYLRVRNWLENEADGTSTDYLEVGVPISPTGAASVSTGYIDIPIVPRPAAKDVSLHDIGLLAGQLNFGSQIFYVSHTFVRNQMRELKTDDPYAVWRDRDGHQVIGIFCGERLFSIASITHRDAGSEIISWKLVGNRLETSSVSD